MIREGVIKMLETSKFAIELIRTPDDRYVIFHENKATREFMQTLPIQDFRSASILFEARVQELEGH